ncbi:hypothetical protein PSPO01_00956 [Paraphaeosphaeria sporulosa]
MRRRAGAELEVASVVRAGERPVLTYYAWQVRLAQPQRISARWEGTSGTLASSNVSRTQLCKRQTERKTRVGSAGWEESDVQEECERAGSGSESSPPLARLNAGASGPIQDFLDGEKLRTACVATFLARLAGSSWQAVAHAIAGPAARALERVSTGSAASACCESATAFPFLARRVRTGTDAGPAAVCPRRRPRPGVPGTRSKHALCFPHDMDVAATCWRAPRGTRRCSLSRGSPPASVPPSTSAAVASRHQLAEGRFAVDGPVRRSNSTSANRHGGSRKHPARHEIGHANLPAPWLSIAIGLSPMAFSRRWRRRASLPNGRMSQRNGAEGFAQEPLNTLSKRADGVRAAANFSARAAWQVGTVAYAGQIEIADPATGRRFKRGARSMRGPNSRPMEPCIASKRVHSGMSYAS